MIKNLEETVLRALNEDASFNDITSKILTGGNKTSEFVLLVNEDAVLSGLELFKATFLIIDKTINVRINYSDGDFVHRGSNILKIFGEAKPVLQAERTALNYLSHLSGIATTTKLLVDKVKHTGVAVLDTRKTTPGLRIYEKKAVLHGGGQNHRLNLSQMVLIKDNHITCFGGIKQALLKAREKYGNKYKIEVEVNNLDELKEIISLRPDIIMFDNWLPKNLKEAIKLVPQGIQTEASGQITLENILDYALCEVNYISTSYMVKNRKWVDFSLEAVQADLT